jgi:hypothetical protein
VSWLGRLPPRVDPSAVSRAKLAPFLLPWRASRTLGVSRHPLLAAALVAAELAPMHYGGEQ